MHAIVFANRSGHELSPLTNRVSVPMLTVLGKPLIVHTLEDLADANVQSALVIVGPNDQQTESALGNGSTWGLQLTYAVARPGDTSGDIARRYAVELPEKLLALRGDVLRGRITRTFLRAAANVLATQVVATIGGRSAGLYLCRQRDLQLDVLNWPLHIQESPDTDWRSIELGRAGYSALDSVTAFYLAHIDGIEHRFRGIASRSGTVKQNQHLASGDALIGARCNIARDATLHGPLIIGDDVTVGKGVFMYSCVVMPGTHIPDGLSIQNAIINSDMAIGIDGRVIHRTLDRQAGRHQAAQTANVSVRPQKAKVG